MNVGFIGLGNMGQPMARNLLKAGHHLLVYNRTRSRAGELLAEGARLAESARDACRGDVVIRMLADDRAVEEGVTGADRVSNRAADRLHVMMDALSVARSGR